MRLVIPRKKAKGKKKARVIYLNPVAFEIVERRVKAQGHGFILLHSRNKPWTKETIKNRVQRFLKPLDGEYCAAAFRHTFCTRALMAGVDRITVSQLLGHSNLSMVANNYSHLCKKPLFLREQLAKVSKPAQWKPESSDTINVDKSNSEVSGDELHDHSEQNAEASRQVRCLPEAD